MGQQTDKHPCPHTAKEQDEAVTYIRQEAAANAQEKQTNVERKEEVVAREGPTAINANREAWERATETQRGKGSLTGSWRRLPKTA